MNAIPKTIAGVALVLLPLAGCGKTQFGVGCEKAVPLTSPWSELGLPIDEKQTRICESTSEGLKLRSYAWSAEDAAMSAFTTALKSAGWAEDRCSGRACYYDKDGFQVSVQPEPFKIKRKALVTVMLHHRADATQKKK
jgi:hypothetical protein